MRDLTIEELLDAGVHYGHQTSRWNPKMKPYILTSRGGIHIINLYKTKQMLEVAYEVTRQAAQKDATILFVGTKKQAKDVIREEAERAHVFYVCERWLGGMLTNFKTIRTSVQRLKELEKMKISGEYKSYTKKEVLKMEKEREKLERNLGGIKDMERLPDLVFLVDQKKEETAVREIKRVGAKLIALTDTNADPDPVDFVIPANDDALKSIRFITALIADAVIEGRQMAAPTSDWEQKEKEEKTEHKEEEKKE
ncbi:MAG: 30S ribosomal protein S2 [candidate division Zixibacteria bacterium 4484_93]|nr:MAG: 30S ribosomal protein S2 [candidate division Zixibacteria bacterium 4484_93]